MEDIKKKAEEDELNVEKDKDIQKQPTRKFIPVPKLRSKKK